MHTITVRVTEIRRATEDAILIYLEATDMQPLQYVAGQFLTFIFERNGRELRRSYSIFTTPGFDKRTGVLVKRVVNGEISRYLLDHLAPGDELLALPPTGRFVLPTNFQAEQKLICIAAGSGISPVFSLMKDALLNNAKDVLLLYQNRNENETLFREELGALAQKYPATFTWMNLLSNPAAHSGNAVRLNNTLLENLLKTREDLSSTRFYLCGPPAFMRMCQFVLQFLHVPADLIHREIFYFDAVPVNPLQHGREPRSIRLKWFDKDFRFTATYPESILDAALKNDIRLPYSCRGGRCSTCTLKCASGKVVMSINETLTERDLREGLVLTCVGFPETDIELEYPF